ncbi:MAG: TonB-dependent receptor [Gemmatimonadetes bacterium]|nr:TonB-dependent receptor [Gemmatimonadota bacterium]
MRVAVGALAIALVAHPAMSQTGILVGRVTNALTGAPVRTAQVIVTGTGISAPVNASGAFRLTNVPVIARELVARSVGYRSVTVPLQLLSNQTATVDVMLTPASVQLDAVIVTGTVGDTRRRAVGNSVGVVNASEIVANSAVSNLTEVLQAKLPGLTLFPPSGTVGTAASYRLRGAGSIYASNSPTIYVDGVRISSRDQGSYDAFGQVASAFDAINPADIETIEVIKGPSAATLYGGEAAAGVIQIFTRKGSAGRLVWTARIDAGRSDWDAALRPMNYAVATPARIADPSTWPGFIGTSVGDVVSYRPMTDGGALRNGSLNKLFLSASGGGERNTFYISGGKSGEEGVQFNNFSNLESLRGRFILAASDKLTLSTSLAASHNHVRLPLNDGAGILGLIASSYLAVPGRNYPYPGTQGYATMTPELANTYDNQTRADRYMLGASADYVPVSWLRGSFRVGVDANVGQAELYFAPDPRTPFFPRTSLNRDNSKGFIAEGRPLTQDVTLSADATATHRVSDTFVSNSSIGAQYLSDVFRRTDAIGVDLGSVGLRSVSAAAVTSAAESSSEQKSLGLYAQQQIAYADRMFVTVAMRLDNNSAFGSKLKRVLYPKASVAYVISDESFFTVPGVSTLRLRGAWGQAGNSPGPFDAARTYTSSVATFATGSSSALRYGSAGNPDLRPERGSEIEVGFESTLFGDRLAVDASFYDKTTRDALMPVAVPPSSGFTGDQLTNLGTISNRGVEILLRGAPVRKRAVIVDVSLALSANRNRLVSFGDARGPIIFGFNAPSQRYQEGYPVGAMWAQQVQRNADGSPLINAGRPVIDTASVYVGPTAPSREMSLSGGIQLFGRLRFSGLADYKGGNYQFNVNDWRRDRAGVSWETVNPAADPSAVLVRQFASQTLLHIQPADFIKLRDLAVTFDLPAPLLHGVARSAALTLAGHNLRIWTRYAGADPEVNYSGPVRFNRDDSWVVPQTRRYSATAILGF